MKPAIEKAVQLVQYENYTCAAAAKKCKVSISGVSTACHRLSIPVGKQGPAKKTQPKKNSKTAKAINLVLNKKMSVLEAAKKIGISHQAVYNALKRYNIIIEEEDI